MKMKKVSKKLEDENKRMEMRLQQLKMAMSIEREERIKSGEHFWRKGQPGAVLNYKSEDSISNQQQPTIDKSKNLKLKILKNQEIKTLPDQMPNKKSIIEKAMDLSNVAAPATTNHSKDCGQCEKITAAVHCHECVENYCAKCFATFHMKGALRKHRSTPISIFNSSRTHIPSPLFTYNSANATNKTSAVPDTKKSGDITGSKLSPPTGNASGSIDDDQQEYERKRQQLYARKKLLDENDNDNVNNGMKSENFFQIREVNEHDEAEVNIGEIGGEEGKGGGLFNGVYDERKAAQEFQEALQNWRNAKRGGPTINHGVVDANIGTTASSARTNSNSSMGDADNSGGGSSGTPLVDIVFTTHNLSYAERLLLEKNRRAAGDERVHSGSEASRKLPEIDKKLPLHELHSHQKNTNASDDVVDVDDDDDDDNLNEDLEEYATNRYGIQSIQAFFEEIDQLNSPSKQVFGSASAAPAQHYEAESQKTRHDSLKIELVGEEEINKTNRTARNPNNPDEKDKKMEKQEETLRGSATAPVESIAAALERTEEKNENKENRPITGQTAKSSRSIKSSREKTSSRPQSSRKSARSIRGGLVKTSASSNLHMLASLAPYLPPPPPLQLSGEQQPPLTTSSALPPALLLSDHSLSTFKSSGQSSLRSSSNSSRLLAEDDTISNKSASTANTATTHSNGQPTSGTYERVLQDFMDLGRREKRSGDDDETETDMERDDNSRNPSRPLTASARPEQPRRNPMRNQIKREKTHHAAAGTANHRPGKSNSATNLNHRSSISYKLYQMAPRSWKPSQSVFNQGEFAHANASDEQQGNAASNDVWLNEVVDICRGQLTPTERVEASGRDSAHSTSSMIHVDHNQLKQEISAIDSLSNLSTRSQKRQTVKQNFRQSNDNSDLNLQLDNPDAEREEDERELTQLSDELTENWRSESARVQQTSNRSSRADTGFVKDSLDSEIAGDDNEEDEDGNSTIVGSTDRLDRKSLRAALYNSDVDSLDESQHEQSQTQMQTQTQTSRRTGRAKMTQPSKERDNDNNDNNDNNREEADEEEDDYEANFYAHGSSRAAMIADEDELSVHSLQ